MKTQIKHLFGWHTKFGRTLANFINKPLKKDKIKIQKGVKDIKTYQDEKTTCNER